MNPYVTTVAEFRAKAPFSGNTAASDGHGSIYADVPDQVIQDAMDAAAQMFENAFRNVGKLPLGPSAKINDIKRAIIIAAARDALAWKGYTDESQQRYLEVEYASLFVGDKSWLARITEGLIRFDKLDDATPTVDEGTPVVSIGYTKRDPRSSRQYNSRGEEVL